MSFARAAAVTLASCVVFSASVAMPGTATAEPPSCTETDRFKAWPYPTADPYFRWLPTTTTKGETDCTLVRGARDGNRRGVHGWQNPVALLQRVLQRCYGQDIADDGSFGPLTEAALKNAQAKEGAEPTGRYGPETRDRLVWLTASEYGGDSFCSRS